MAKRGRKYMLTRTNDQTGKVYVVNDVTLFEAQQQVAFCCHDNAGMTKRDSSIAAAKLTADGPLSVGGYTFVLSGS